MQILIIGKTSHVCPWTDFENPQKLHNLCTFLHEYFARELSKQYVVCFAQIRYTWRGLKAMIVDSLSNVFLKGKNALLKELGWLDGWFVGAAKHSGPRCSASLRVRCTYPPFHVYKLFGGKRFLCKKVNNFSLIFNILNTNSIIHIICTHILNILCHFISYKI